MVSLYTLFFPSGTELLPSCTRRPISNLKKCVKSRDGREVIQEFLYGAWPKPFALQIRSRLLHYTPVLSAFRPPSTFQHFFSGFFQQPHVLPRLFSLRVTVGSIEGNAKWASLRVSRNVKPICKRAVLIVRSVLKTRQTSGKWRCFCWAFQMPERAPL